MSMKINSIKDRTLTLTGLRALTTAKERQEIRAIGIKPIKWVLKYHRGSEKMGKAFGIDCRLWDVLSPKLPGYRYDSDSHIPTLSIDGLKKYDKRFKGQVGLIKQHVASLRHDANKTGGKTR